jgi:hypothetical protein
MQSRIVKSVDLFNEFPRVYKIADYNKESQANLILNGSMANFFLIESYGYNIIDDPKSEFKDFTINTYKSMCADILYNTILELRNEAEHVLGELNSGFINKWINHFKNKEAINDIKTKIDKMNQYLSDKKMIQSHIEFKYEYLNETLKVPFYRLHEGQKVYLVIQDPQHFMKVQEAVVKTVKPLNTSSDAGTLCDIEFEYDIKLNNTVTQLGYQSLRTFDGSKCMVNYNYTIFVDLNDAKDNCRKVLNSLKSQIDQQIQIVDNFKGTDYVSLSS